ncbi:hypothetical protein KDL29_07035 [bacterium]|nr:hypothetical protein [bacterium]
MSIFTSWNEPGPAPGSCFVAAANFSSGRWQWQGDVGGQVTFGELADFISPQGNIYTIVLLAGEQDAKLSYLVLGDVPPFLIVQDDLDNDPLQNVAPCTVIFDASGSGPVINPISHFDYDFDGDGNYDLSNNEDGIASHEYPAGNFLATIRVTDSAGLSDTITREINIVDPNNLAPLADIQADTASGEAPLSVTLDPSGSSDADGTIVRYRWDLDNDGDWDQTYDEPLPASISIATKGSHTVVLEVQDNYFATDIAQIEITTLTGWTASAAGSDLLTGTDLAIAGSLAAGGAYACIAYADSTGRPQLVSSSDETGATWGAPQDPAGSQDPMDDQSIVKLLGSTNEDRLMYAWDQYDDSGGQRRVHFNSRFDGAWSEPVLLNDSEDCSLQDLELIGGIPTIGGIVWRNVLNISYPAMFRATDADGSGWGSLQGIQLAQPGGKCTYMTLGHCTISAELRPLAAYNFEQFQSDPLLAIRSAADIAGNLWLDEVSIGSVAVNALELAELDNLPALAWSLRLNEQSIKLQLADDGTASTFSNPAVKAGENRSVLRGIAFEDGLPVICSWLSSQERVVIYRASDSSGTLWSGPEIVYDNPLADSRPAIASVDGQLLIAAADGTGNLVCIHWEE